MSDAVALRGAVSTGFRAPTPGQQNAFNVTTEFDFDLGDLINLGVIPSINPVAQLRGGEPLQPGNFEELRCRNGRRGGPRSPSRPTTSE